jgi:hypothetical protein
MNRPSTKTRPVSGRRSGESFLKKQIRGEFIQRYANCEELRLAPLIAKRLSVMGAQDRSVCRVARTLVRNRGGAVPGKGSALPGIC